MKKARIAVLLAAAVLSLTPAAGCRTNKKPVEKTSSASAYADISEVGKNKVDVKLEEKAEVNETTFKVNRVINSGRVKDGLKYIYLDVTIKNTSSDNYEINSLNNFYLLLSDGTEILTDVRADIYAKQSMEGYEPITEVKAGAEVSAYIGFAIDEAITDFTACFFPTGTADDKSNVIRCEVKAADIVSAPDGMFKETDK